MGMVERFEEKISPEPNSGCWLWVASDIQSTGYGFFRHPLTTKAHRASYLIYKGEIPHGMCVCHKCDVRFCTIFLPCPAYLKPRGSSHGLSKLTEGDVVNIRAEHEGLRSVAQKYGLNEKTVWQIKTRRIWKHVP